MTTPRIEYMCPHCGWRFDALLAHQNKFGAGLVPEHAYPRYGPVGGRLCPGSNQNPRNPESDRRPLWKDLPNERAPTDHERKAFPLPPLTPGNWRVTGPTGDGDGWRIHDPSGRERARYADTQVMAEHCAMGIEHADRQAAEIERLRAGLEMIAQIIHGSTRVTRMIAEATLGGANLLDEDVAIDVCEGNWRPNP